jgi:ubiquinone biosynthesis protein
VEVQPQLVLLQKTLLNIEGLGRQLDPNLDLWKTAKPYLERWMHEQVGWHGLFERLRAEAPRYSHLIPQLPRLAHQALTQAALPQQQNSDLLRSLIAEQRRTNVLLSRAVYFGGGLLGGILLAQWFLHWHHLLF